MEIKTLLLTTTLLVSTLAFADAYDAAPKQSNNTFKDFYAKVEAGLTMPSKGKIKQVGTGLGAAKAKFDKGFVGGAGGGFRFNEFFRSDLMFHYRNSQSQSFKATLKEKVEETGKQKVEETGKQKVTAYRAMLNGYLDAHNDTIFTPYVMAGFGLGYIKPELSGFTGAYKLKPQTNLIWNTGLGCQAKVYENVSLDLGYKYVDLGKVKGMKKRLSTHEVVLGLVYDL